MRKTMALLATTVVASLFALSNGQQVWAKDLADEIRTQVEVAVERSEKQAEDVLSEAAERDKENEARPGDASMGKAVLKISGDPGTEFSGTCVVGGAERSIGGEVPQTYTYDVDGRKLDCEVRNKGGGDLRIVFDTEGAHSEQSIGSEGGVSKLVYDDGVFVTSSLSRSSSQTVVQSSTSSQVISSRR